MSLTTYKKMEEVEDQVDLRDADLIVYPNQTF